MGRIIAIARRELAAYFATPVAYIVVIFFLVVTSGWFFFVNGFFAQDTATLRGYFSLWPIVFIALIPAITMRSWAEERRQGTAEILLTLPVRERELVAGKFAAACALLLVLVVLTLPLPLSVLPFGTFEPGQIAMEYLGVLLLGCAGIAAGQFVSALSANQISAFLFGVAFMLVITMIRMIIYAPIIFPLPVFHAAIHPKAKGDEDRMSTGLHALHQEDPTFVFRVDGELHQTIISGQGELHLDIVVKRLKQRYNVDVDLSEPRVAYRETIKAVV
jgi:ABC-2 type transport system permease protein